MNLKDAKERMGLRDFEDPEARRRANEEDDLTINMTFVRALLVSAAFDLLCTTIISEPEQIVEYIKQLQAMFPSDQAKEALVAHMQSMNQQAMAEIYRKQREIYADTLH